MLEICDLPKRLKESLARANYKFPDWETFKRHAEHYPEEEVAELFKGATACIEPRVGGSLEGLCGVSGSGKSSRAGTMARAAISQGFRVTWFDTEGSCPKIENANFTCYRTYDAMQLLATVRMMSRSDLIVVDSVGFAFRHCDDRESLLALFFDALIERGRCKVLVVNQTTTENGEVFPLFGKQWVRFCNSNHIIYWGV